VRILRSWLCGDVTGKIRVHSGRSDSWDEQGVGPRVFFPSLTYLRYRNSMFLVKEAWMARGVSLGVRIREILL
jgi:hypothetical protein